MFAQREKVNYDNEHDVLYIFIGPPKIAYEDEISPGIFLRKDDDTDEVIGVIIMGYKKVNKSLLPNIIPLELDYSKLNKFVN